MDQLTKYNSRETARCGHLVATIEDRRKDGGSTGAAILDSVKNEAGSTVDMPKRMLALMEHLPEAEQTRLLDAVSTGIDIFKTEHGRLPTGDVIEAAIQQAHAAFNGIGTEQEAKMSNGLLDAVSNSASSGHSEPMSLQPNRAVVAVLAAIAEACPFASYLPFDIGSNQSKLAILAHTAGTAFGDYAAGAGMDGTSAGLVYAASSRFAAIDHSGAVPYTTKFTTTNLAANPGFCDPAGTGVPVLRGRTILYVNGKVAAIDSPIGNGATSAISGTVTTVDPSNGNAPITYTIAGTVTIATGAVSLSTVTPDFTTGTSVFLESVIDFEASPALIPDVTVRADTFDMYASPWRVKTSITIDSSTQLRNELNLDGASEAIMAMRTQVALERHYKALRFAEQLGLNQPSTYDFAFPTRSAQMVRAQIWQDFQAHLANEDQVMANRTMDHGITHLYVSGFLAGIMQSLPDSMFVSSGIAARPGLYRVGRLFGKYDVYYSPRIATQSADLKTHKIIAVGRSANVAQCPVVFGDAVAPTFLDLNMLSDLKRSAAIYARDLTAVNPHDPSSNGCATITMTNVS